MFLKATPQTAVAVKPDLSAGPRPEPTLAGPYTSNPVLAKQASKELTQIGGYSTNSSQHISQGGSNQLPTSAQNSNTFATPTHQPVLINSGLSAQGNPAQQPVLLQTKTSQDSSKEGDRSVGEYEEILGKLTEAKSRVKDLSNEVSVGLTD
jgi:hypothetical protein